MRGAERKKPFTKFIFGRHFANLVVTHDNVLVHEVNFGQFQIILGQGDHEVREFGRENREGDF